MPDKLVTVAKFTESCEADLARQVLGDFGIKSVVTGQNFANMYPAPISTIDLQVLESDFREAMEILESGRSQEQ